MKKSVNPIKLVVQQAIDRGTVLETREVRMLRARSQKVVLVLKGVFWGGIVIANLALWVPLPVAIDRSVLNLIAPAALVIAVVVPFCGLRRHQMNLELLRVTDQQPKRKTASDQAKVYMDKVKQQDRPFINAEYELLEGSKWSSQAGPSDR